MAGKNSGKRRGKRRAGRMRTAAMTAAGVICLGQLVALGVAFYAGAKWEQKRRKGPDATLPDIPAELLGATTGLAQTDERLAGAEREWDQDSGAV